MVQFNLHIEFFDINKLNTSVVPFNKIFPAININIKASSDVIKKSNQQPERFMVSHYYPIKNISDIFNSKSDQKQIDYVEHVQLSSLKALINDLGWSGTLYYDLNEYGIIDGDVTLIEGNEKTYYVSYS